MLSIVVAIDKDRAIGRENKIPWRLRDDLVRLRQLTEGHVVILGRKTYESMIWYYDKSGKELPGRLYIVITRDVGYAVTRQNATVVHSIDEALATAEEMDDDDMFVIGGGAIYKAMLPYVDRIYLTEVNTRAGGDAFFPELSPAQWHEAAREHYTQDERNEFDYDVITLDRV